MTNKMMPVKIMKKNKKTNPTNYTFNNFLDKSPSNNAYSNKINPNMTNLNNPTILCNHNFSH